MNISVEIDGWTVLPIADQGTTTHLIATRNDDEALFTDIDVVLYERLADGWSATAYDPQVTKEDAMMDIANEFGLADPHGGDWLIDLDEEDFLDYFLPRVPFGKGFFVADPLHNIAQQLTDPEPLAEGAEQAGLAAGSSAINTGSISGGPFGGSPSGDPEPLDGGCGCEEFCVQDIISTEVDEYFANLAIGTQGLAQEVVSVLVNEFQSCCWPRTVSSTTNGLWSCGPWTFDFRSNSASIGQDNCHYKRAVTRTIFKFGVEICGDCSEWSFSQTCTESGTQQTRDTVADADPCLVIPENEPDECVPHTGVTRTSWAPPKPSC